MTRYLLCSLVLLVFFPAFLLFAATEISGTITAKRGDSVQVSFAPHQTAGPAIGDTVSFSLEIPGSGGIRAKAGEGTVTAVEGTTVWVKTSDNRPNLSMDAVIQATGTVERKSSQVLPKGGYLGVTIANLTEEMKQQSHPPASSQGVLILNIDPDSPAEKAGLAIGDLIVECNGGKIFDTMDLVSTISSLAPREKILLYFLRNGKSFYKLVPLGANPSNIRVEIIHELTRLNYLSADTKDVPSDILQTAVDLCGILEGFATGHPINAELLQRLKSIDSK